MSEQRRYQIGLPIAIVLAGVLISGSIIWSAQTLKGVTVPAEIMPGPTPTPPESPVSITDIDAVALDGNPFIGDPSAPVAMAFWFDYQCPYCREVEEKVMPQLVKDYVDTGKLRIYFKDYEFLGPDSQRAALMARAVWDIAPNSFYEWHTAVFAHQDTENSGWGSDADLLTVTKSISGIDANALTGRMAEKRLEYEKALQADLSEGSDLGINGTPGTIVGDQLISGARPYAVFKAAIDQALAAKGAN